VRTHNWEVIVLDENDAHQEKGVSRQVAALAQDAPTRAAAAKQKK